MEQQNIIMLCQQNWGIKLGTNARSLAKEFAKQNRVLYVNMPLDVKAFLSGYRRPEIQNHFKILLGLAEGLTQVESNLWVYTPDCLALSINWLTSRRLFSVFNKLNAYLLTRSIRKAADTLGFDASYLLQDGIIFQGTELKQRLRPQQFIYYLRDYMLSVPYFRRHGLKAETQLLQQADLVVANSAYLTDYARQKNLRSYDIGQGCGLSLYQAHVCRQEPADLALVPSPRIGYTGFLTSVRLDLKLLITIAQRHPDWHLVLVGPEDVDFKQSPLHTLPNVHFLGNKTPDLLPAYLQHFDVCINPQVNNATTAGNYPLKIDEYLAMGKPVVATSTRTMEMFQQHVYLAKDADEWLHLLETALSNSDPDRVAEGIAFAQSHTWAASAAKLYAAVREVSQTASVPGTTAATPLAHESSFLP